MATNQKVLLQPRPNVKQINYISKTFADFRQNLIEFSKAYYPNTYADFNETSPGMMFIEMASYLGDVMSFYIDNQFKENLLAYADQPENIITLAQFLGYKPNLISVATTEAELSVTVPSTVDSNGVYVPDSRFMPIIGKGSIFSTDNGLIQFRLMHDVDFTKVVAGGGEPSEFLVTKTCNLSAGVEKNITLNFGTFQKFTTTLLPDEQIIGIESVVDSDGNKWYEVDYLAQDVIMDDVDIVDNAEEGTMPSYGMRLRKVPRRFVTRVTRDFRTQLVFGSGETNDAETDVLVDSRQIANAQYGNTITNTVSNIALNNLNFLNSSAFGLSPANTTLTVKYIVGGGANTNASSNTITVINNLNILNDTAAFSGAEQSAFNATIQRIAVTNPQPATGGGNGESLDEIRENALMFFNAQNRVVTRQDYVVRSYALPQRYGSIAKAYALRDEQLNSILSYTGGQFVENEVRPTSVNLYTLGYDADSKLTSLNTIVKDNLARYLEQYRLLTDDVTILDAFIINIGVKFNITIFRNYNMNDVLARSIDTVQNFFNIDNWNIGQPIILSDLIYQIGSVDGVQNVTNVQIFNKYQFVDGENYQPYRYDITQATVNGVIYPSLDPSIFELKYPQTDIIGNASQ